MTTTILTAYKPRRTVVTHALLALLAIVIVSTSPAAQSFSSGSDGSDGALTLTTAGTVVFDPFDTARWGKVLDADGAGVYNFTTITIGAGVTVRLGGDKVNRPVYWLASGNVVISGTIDLRGADHNSRATTGTPDPDIRRLVAIPGSGGYAGGAGGRDVPRVEPTPGEGPGGGVGGVVGCNFNQSARCGRGGTFTGNRFLIPLVGGSGGEGALYPPAGSNFYDAGGAGGGAILIASSSSIALAGAINASGGGSGGWGGAGSGGAVRLVAPNITTGSFDVRGGESNGSFPLTGGAGWVRLEGNQITPATTGVNPASSLAKGALPHPSTLRPASSVRVTAIDGIIVSPDPSGNFQVPDAVINNAEAVNVDIQATGIPPGTSVTLWVYPEIPVDSTTVYLPTVQATLTGTLQSSTATAAFQFPYGVSRGFIRANW